MEQKDPFPRIPSPDHSENESSPEPAPGHSGSTAPPPGFTGQRLPSRGHPGDRIFSFGEENAVLLSDKNPLADQATAGVAADSAVVSTTPSTGGSVSPSQLDSMPQFNNFPFNGINFGGRPMQFFPGINLEHNEKMRELKKKKEKRDRKAGKEGGKVADVKKAEDMEGYQGDKDVTELLKSLGEAVVEDKKQKIKKPKEKKDKKKKSIDKSSTEESKEELELEEDIKEDQKKREKEISKKPVSDNLQNFSKNLNPVYTESVERGSLALGEGLTQSTDSLNFVQVTGKKKGRKVKDEGNKLKDYPKRSKEDTGRPPPPPGGTRAPLASGRTPPPSAGTRERMFIGENRRTSNYSLRSRDVQVQDTVDADHQPSTDLFPAFDIPQEFPALSSISSAPSTTSLAPVWSKRTSSTTSETKAVIPDSEASEATASEAAASDISPGPTNCDKPDTDVPTAVIAQPEVSADIIDIEPEGVAVTDDHDADVCEDMSERKENEEEVDDSLDQLEDEDLEERFEFDTRFNPVVAAPAVTEEESAEISFGFEVNEELVTGSVCDEGTLPSTPLPEDTAVPAPIDTVDDAILSFGAMEQGSNGVPIPFGMVTDNNFNPVVPQMNRDMLCTSLSQEGEVEDAVSPESGISSASPLSWQSPNLDLDQSTASPTLQPGSYPRPSKPQDASFSQQVNDSLEKWSRSSSPDLSVRRVDSGWESRISASVDSEAGGREESRNYRREEEKTYSNYSEIVSFLQNNWQAYSKEKKMKMFGEKKQRR